MGTRGAGAHAASMFRRVLVSALWFAAFLCMHELAWSLFGSPRMLGVAIGALAAAYVWLYPTGAFWGRGEPRTQAVAVRAIPDSSPGAAR